MMLLITATADAQQATLEYGDGNGLAAHED
jgi:hypothetical protein